MTEKGEGLAGDPWEALETPVAHLGITESAAALLVEHGYELLVDLARMQPGKMALTRVQELRTVAMAKLETFAADLLKESLEPYDALTSNVAVLDGISEPQLRALWAANITTISTLVTARPARFRFPIARWVRGATLLARASPVPRDIDGLFDREFAPRSMFDVLTASPRYLMGIGPVYARSLRHAGITTIGAMAARSAADLRRDLGVSPLMATAFADRAAAAAGIPRKADRVDDAMADLRAAVTRFRVAVDSSDLGSYGRDIDVMARAASAMLEEYLDLMEEGRRTGGCDE